MDGDDRSRGTGGPSRCRQPGRFWRAVAVALCISLPALAFLTFDGTGTLIRQAFVATAEAGSNNWNGGRNWNNNWNSRRAEEEAERARRQAEEARRAAEEAARRAAEEAARRARQAAEQASRNSRNQQSDSSRKDDKQTETANNNKNNKNDSSDNPKSSKDEGDEESKRSDDDDQNGRPRKSARSSDDDETDRPPPATVVDLLNRWMGKGKGAPEWSGKTSVIHSGNQASADKGQDGVMRVTPPGTVESQPQNNKSYQGTQNAKSSEPEPAAGKAPARIQRGAPALAMPPLPVMNKRELLAINLSRQSLDKLLAKGFEAREAVDLSHLGFSMVRVETPPGMDAKHARAWLGRELPKDRFEYNQTYRHYRAATGGDDFDPPGQRSAPSPAAPCGSDRCYAPAAINWTQRLSSCAKGVHVGVIDTAVDPALFADRQVHHGNAAPKGQPKAASWHGNGVLALLSGASSGDTPGLIPDAHFFVADTFAADSDGQPVSDTASVLKALDLLSAFKAQVINMSLSGPADETVRKAIEKLSREGAIFIAAAGNGGPTAPPAYPAAYPPVIAVTAVNRNLNGYPYANRGKYIDVAAPGVRIWTAVGKEKQDYLSGTSFATPYVTAIVAAVANSGPINKAAILARLAVKDLGDPGPDPVYGRGLVLAPDSCNPGPIRAPVATSANPWVVKTSSSP